MRIFIVCLGYNRHDVIRGAMENLEATTTDVEHRRLVKTVFNCQFPLPSVAENRAKTIELAREFGWWHAEIPNEGVMGNHNRAIHEYCHIQPGDFYVTFDPDVRMNKPGWISAMVEALNSDPRAMFCSSAMDFHHHDWMQKPPYNRKVTQLPSGLNVARYDCLIAWPSGMWKGEYLASRPRNFAQRGKFYGWSEHADHARLVQNNWTWLSVPDYVDHHLGSPEESHIKWKQASASGATSKPFDQWLRDGMK